MSYRLALIVSVLFIIGAANKGWSQQINTSGTTKVTSNRIGFEIGFIKGYVKDLNLSPFNYREQGSLFSFNYTRHRPQGRHLFTADIDFGTGNMKSKVSDFFSAQHIMGNVEVSSLWRISRDTRKLSFFIGPQYNTFIQYVNWDDQEAWSYLATHGLNVKGMTTYALSDRKHFEMSLSIPVLQIFVRPPYNGYDLYIQEHSEEIARIAFRGTLSSFDKYQAVDWKTVYRYIASHRVDFVFAYLFRYQHVSGYNELTHFQNNFTIGLAIKI